MKRHNFSRLFHAMVAMVLLSLFGLVQAQVIRVATGGPATSSTYTQMFVELQKFCGKEAPLEGVLTTGAIDNVNLLVDNQVNAAFVQPDVLFVRAQTQDMRNVKTLIALHREQVHILALTESKSKAGGLMNVLADKLQFDSLPALAGRKVGAAGGSVVTAELIRAKSGIQYQVVVYKNNAEVLGALDAGAIDAGLVVGGQPMPFIKSLDRRYKLIAIPPATVALLPKEVYGPDTLSYQQLGIAGVSTVSMEALFVTREYKSAKMVNALARFRACAREKIDEIKDTTGTHAAWQTVDPSAKGRWPYYDLPTAVAATN